MAYVKLELLKKHVHADDFTADDTYLTHLLESAERYVLDATYRTEAELFCIGGGVMPLPLQQAVLLLAGHWYNQREAVSGVQMAEVPYTLQALIKPFRKLVHDESRCDEI